MGRDQLISLTLTKIYLYCLKTTEKGSKLDPAMFSGHAEVPRLHPCIHSRGLFISPILNKHEHYQYDCAQRGSDTKAIP